MNRSRLRRAAVAAGCAAAVAVSSGCSDPPPPLSEGPPGAAPADGLTRIVRLSAERAVLSDRLAAATVGTPAAVPDPAREARLVADARADAARVGVDPGWAARVVADQVAAGTGVRRDRIRSWTDRPETRPAQRPDLARVRSELERIGDELVAALAVAAPGRTHEDCPTTLAQAAVSTARGLDEVHRVALGTALRSVCDGGAGA